MKRTIDMMKNHQRASSASSIGSWISEMGADLEDLSHGTSEVTNRMRLVSGMAILASSSPEIKALSLSRNQSFSWTSHGNNQNTSPSSSIASNFLETSFEETKCSANILTDDNQSSISLCFENLNIEPPPLPRREAADLPSMICGEKENSTTDRDSGQYGGNSAKCSTKKRFFRRATVRDTTSKNEGSQKPPMPLKTPGSSMHRRASFDSLPTPSEIGTTMASVKYSFSSERCLKSFPRQYPSSLDTAKVYSSTSERGLKTLDHHDSTPDANGISMSQQSFTAPLKRDDAKDCHELNLNPSSVRSTPASGRSRKVHHRRSSSNMLVLPRSLSLTKTGEAASPKERQHLSSWGVI